MLSRSVTEPVHGPGGDHVKLFRVHRLHHGIEPRSLVPALGATNAGVLVDLDELPAGSLSNGLQLATLIVGRLFVSGDSEIDGYALHGDPLPKRRHYDIALYCNQLISVYIGDRKVGQ
jgi:hypothetical protein